MLFKPDRDSVVRVAAPISDDEIEAAQAAWLKAHPVTTIRPRRAREAFNAGKWARGQSVGFKVVMPKKPVPVPVEVIPEVIPEVRLTKKQKKRIRFEMLEARRLRRIARRAAAAETEKGKRE